MGESTVRPKVTCVGHLNRWAGLVGTFEEVDAAGATMGRGVLCNVHNGQQVTHRQRR